jgi:hypothetical protein
VRGTTLIFLVAGLLLAMPASAQTPEVQVDPNSPAGTEYAIPLDKARQEAAGRGGKDAKGQQGSGSPELFGEGIQKKREEPAPAPEPAETPEEVPAEPVPAEAAEEKPDRAKKKRSKGKQGDAKSASVTASSDENGSDPPQRTAATIDAGSDDDGSAGLTMGGIAVGVLGLGLLLGVGFRRLLRSS